MEFKDLSLIEIIEKIKSWETTAQEVTSYFKKRIKKYNEKLNCFEFVNEDENNISKDSTLAWIPLWLKALFAEKWVETNAGSKMLKDFKPEYDSTVIKNLKEAWFFSLWKVYMDEFAMWTTWENSAFEKSVNPWGTNRIPWWSSSWSAVAVAWWLVPASLWTDTWGSIRQPASLCWVVWFKPSYWRNSRYWVVAMSSSLDTPWTFTKTVRDAGLLYDVMNWEDENDLTMLWGKQKINDKIWETSDLKWKTIWIPKEYFAEGLDSWVKETIMASVEKMKELWAEIKEVSLPTTKYAISAYYIICPAEVSTNLARYDGIRYGHKSTAPYWSLDEMYENNRSEWLWEEPQRRSIIWSYALSAWFYDAYFKKATQIREKIIDEFAEVFEDVDAIVAPASPSVAWEFWGKTDPLQLYLADAYTIPPSLAWLPWISIPCWFAISEDENKEELPVWMQIIWKYKDEESILEIANVFEKNTQHHKKTPDM